MSLLKQKILQKIRADGPISFEQFMEMALYYPGLGYYTRPSNVIGREGDFYTSPHLHPVFGAMLCRQMEEMWNLLRRPEVFHIVEMGAGMGYLAKDILDYSGIGKGQKAKGKRFSNHIKYTIVELNPSVKARQQALLKDHTGSVLWVSCLDELDSFTGCFLSNELLDAFPVRLVEIGDELSEVYLSEGEGDLIELKVPCSDEIEEYFEEFSLQPAKGYRTEVNLKVKDWLAGVCDKLTAGFVLTVDYGYPAWDYYSEERNRGTLLCYYNHQFNEEPYQNIGEQDLTAHLNFSSLKKWGEGLGLKTVGFCPQGVFLVSLGLDEVILELYGDTPDIAELNKIKGLILPQGMGESHKVMVQYKGDDKPVLRGFAIRNKAGDL